MERRYPQSIGDVLRMQLQQDCMQGRIDECRAADLWADIIGAHVASQCRRPNVSKGLMTIGVPNASLRNELNMSRSAIAREINRQLGRNVIIEVRFTNS